MGWHLITYGCNRLGGTLLLTGVIFYTLQESTSSPPCFLCLFFPSIPSLKRFKNIHVVY